MWHLTPAIVVLGALGIGVVVLGGVLALGQRRPKAWHASSGWLYGGFLTTMGLAVTTDVAWCASENGNAFLAVSGLLKLVGVALAVTAWLQTRRAAQPR